MGNVLDIAEAITEVEFSDSIEQVYRRDGIEVHRKAIDVMAVWQVASSLENKTPHSQFIPAKAVEYEAFTYGQKRFTLYYEELNGT